jgi:diguanylate cyclase (GGDEF)-like protein/PAS domain S-box-containing protein
MPSGDTTQEHPALPLAPNQPAAGATRDEYLLREQVRLLYDHALLSQLVALLNAGILVYILWPVVGRLGLLAWLACMVTLCLLRLQGSRAFVRAMPAPHQVRRWRNRFLAGAAASGLLWGAAGLFLFPEHSLPHQVFVSFVIAGMIAGAVGTLSAVTWAFALFAVPALLPIVLQFLLHAGELGFSMSFMAVLYGLAMAAVARHVNLTIRESLALSQRNGELVEVLTAANAHAEQLNRELHDEIAERRDTEGALRASERSLAEAQRMAQLGSWTYDVATHRAQWSTETFRIYGVEPGSRAPSCWQLLSHLHSEDRRRVYTLLKRAIEAGEAYDTELRVVTPAGELRWVHARGEPERDVFGRVALLRGTVLDISARKRQEQQLEGERRVLQAMAAGAPLERALEQICRLVEEQYPSALCSVLLLDADGQHLRHGAAPGLPQAFCRAADGIPVGPRAGSCGTAAYLNRQVIVSDIATDELWAEARGLALEHGLRACWSTPIPGTEQAVLGTFAVYFRIPRSPTPGEVGLIARATDIARIAIERSAAERRIQQLAHYDELTGLPNRLLFNQALEDALHETAHSAQPLALLFVDVDRFKNVNDTLGHAMGDRLLKEVAGRLRRCLRGGDVLARFGGDEFVVLLPELPYEGYAAGVAARLLAALTDPLRLDDQECHVTASIGVATCPQDGRDAQTLQKHADTALHRAKDQGRNSFCHYSPQGDVHSRERLTLEAHLRRALARGELDLHYQPKQAIAAGAITGMEALLRWRHAELGMVAPVRFIPIAEETGLIVPIGEWVLRTACAHAAALRRDAGIEHPRVAVNLSARQFADQSLVPLVASVLADTGLEAACLELEITESLVMQNPEQAARLLAQLKEMGVQLAMDDFGTGYSSLAYLKRFPVDSIKIDRSFIQGLPGDEEDATITQAVIAMAHSLRLRTIAEGVETAEQLAFLERLGCDEIQGYYFSKPLPFGEIQQFLAAHARRAAPARSAPQIPVWP